MFASCNELDNWLDVKGNLSCKSQAELYYKGVQPFGKPAYLAFSNKIRMA